MIDYLTKIILWLRRRTFLRAAQRTLVMLMPLAVIGSYFNLLHGILFSPDGIIYNIFNLDKIIPDHLWYAGAFVCQGVVEATFGVFSVYTAYFMARYTARLYQRDATMAGASSVIVILFCAYASSVGNSARQKIPFSSNLLQINDLLLSLIVGYVVGQIFRFFGKKYVMVKYEHVRRVQVRSWNALLPMLLSLILGIICGIAIYELGLRVPTAADFRLLIAKVQTSNNVAEILPLQLLLSFLSWLGIGYPLSALAEPINNNFTANNLTAALHSDSSWNVPYKFLGGSLINTYGTMGGTSIVLAVLVVILLRKRHDEVEAIAKINLLPVTFNSILGFTIGLPLILDPLFLLPVLFVPLVNVALAAGAIAVHLIPACVYPVLKGTPGILLSFFATNGNLVALLFSVLLFFLDLLLLLPIVKISEKVEATLREERKDEHDAEEN
ncbi:PTS sugar transporter subunit IIC [Lactobacillus sp. ESL0791]|uniref:PTS sugar transporter subunit IIC n=1 Tax=Lactobacillus sp. ESL0791 TaxID=2983234 RepID=UPI0023F680F4|nr:PTS sugar transporter subunit IIC [Lactobacillus sp. ESL0791]MDF7639778.1 PTS sugar transporter subunit IIC [Lactobacillus sp. ESL0791]